MTSAIQLRANESMLFEGDVSNIKSMTNIVEGSGVVTNQRCAFQWGEQAFAAEKNDLASVAEQKHGFATKIVVQHRNGESIIVQAANLRGLKNALYALAGMQFDEAAVTQPDLKAVRNGTAWIAAFGPLLADLLTLLTGALFGWNWEAATTFQLLKVVVFKVFLIYFFIRIDHISLQRQGFNTGALGIVAPENFPKYLFSRAKAFGHGNGYAITWVVLVGLEVITLLFG